MMSFIWSSDYPLESGKGGTEAYTIGQVRELLKRGYPARIISIGFGDNDGRDNFPDIPFVSMELRDLEKLDDTLFFISNPLPVTTKQQSFVILHCPPHADSTKAHPGFGYYNKGIIGKTMVTPSRYAAKIWADYLKKPLQSIKIVHPFADQAFGQAKRVMRPRKKRILYAGRLTPEKGIFTLLASLHTIPLQHENIEFTVLNCGADTIQGKIISKLLSVHPLINLIPAAPTPSSLANIMTAHDVLVMPSTHFYWNEFFGMLSVEAQHAGCRVIASNDGGLPETSCGGLLLFEPDNPMALAKGIVNALHLGALTNRERTLARTQFTVQQSVDTLLDLLRQPKRP
jgi:glycosyltransferase involved in cell wall biosynthesis